MSVNQCKVFGLYDELSTFMMCIEAKDCLSHMIWQLFCPYTMDSFNRYCPICVV